MSAPDTAAFDRYASRIGRASFGNSPHFYRRRLMQDSERLFADTGGGVQILCWTKTGEDREILDLQSGQDLADFLTNTNDQDHSHAYVILQRNTWDRLCITGVDLLQILSHNSVFMPFLDCVHSYGFKINDDDESWEGYHKLCHYAGPQNGLRHYEFCYNIRYVAANGRSTGFPWSVRQTAVYQRLDIMTGHSNWIIIQPDGTVMKRFQETCQSCCGVLSQQMDPHFVFLSAAVSDWKPFIGHLRKTLEALDEKASFSRIGKVHRGDYSITFSDAQMLQKTRQKLFRSLVILDGTLEVLKGFKAHCHELESLGIISSRKLGSYLEDLKSSLKYHKSVVKRLIEHSSGTASLLEHIPDYRLAEGLGQSSKAMEFNIKILQNIADATMIENRNMVQLTKESRQDSARIKALTLITILYLPATLLATIFSSNLVDTQNNGSWRSHLTVAPQFWLYVLLSLAITGITIAFAYVMERKALRRP